MDSQNLPKLVEDLREFLEERDGKANEYDEALARKLIERITVFDDHYAVEFKSGIETTIQG